MDADANKHGDGRTATDTKSWCGNHNNATAHPSSHGRAPGDGAVSPVA